LLITSARAMPTKTLRANKFVRSGKHEFSSASSKNIYPNLDIQYSSLTQ
jgi:hypothetical protein